MSMVKRWEWGAPKTKWGIGPPIKFPLKNIFCLPTDKRRCFNLKQCTRELLYLHERHTCTPTCPDIKYSFFIGTNGTVYECRGWRTRPGLPKKFENINKSSLLIALAGQYNKYNTPPAMINARDYVIRYGVKHDLIDKDYVLHSSVDHSTISESEVDYDLRSGDQESGDQDSQDQETGDQETGDQDTGDQETGDQETGDQETGDQETGDQETEDQGTEDQDDDDQEADDGDWRTQPLGSNWEDKFADDLSTVSGSSVKSWESYSSSWDFKPEDIENGDSSDGDFSDGDI